MGTKTEILELMNQMSEDKQTQLKKLCDLLLNSSKADLKDLLKKLESEKKANKTGKDIVDALKAEKIIGIWKDRDDVGDSQSFARELRKKAENRGA